jgi:multidrug resistance efflux pump
VKEGQTVAKGAPLLELESGPLEAQLALAESGLAQARNGLAQAQSGASQQTSAIDAANAGISAAQTGVNVAHDFKSLADKAVVDAQKYLDALQAMPGADPDTVLVAQEALSAAKRGQTEAAAGIAQTNGQLASAQGALAQAQSGNTSAAITAAHAAIAAAEEQVELASKMLEDAVIKASVAGKIIFVQTDATAQSQAAGAGTPISGATLMAGSAIAPGMPLFTIISPDKMIFVAEVNEADIARIKIDHKATVTLDSFAGTTFTGTVTKIAPVAQMTMTGSTVFPVEITLDPTKEKPAIGMKGDAAIQVSTQQGVTTIPVLALFSEGGKQFVYVLRDGRLAKTPITTGEVTDAQVEVISGVVSGQEVVLASNIPFTDSMRVRVRAR